MFRHKKTKKRTMRRRYNKKSRKNFKGGAVPDFIAVMKSLIPANHTASMNTGSGLPTKASTSNPFIKGGNPNNKLPNTILNNTNRWRERARENVLDNRLKTVRNNMLDDPVPVGSPLTKAEEKGITAMKTLRERARENVLDTRLRNIRHNMLDDPVPVGSPLTKAEEKGITAMKTLRERARENVLDKRLRNIRHNMLDEPDLIGLPLTRVEEKGVTAMKNLRERARENVLDKRLRTIRHNVLGGKKTRKSRKNKTTQKGGLARSASHKTWVCRGNIGCAKNINIY